LDNEIIANQTIDGEDQSPDAVFRYLVPETDYVIKVTPVVSDDKEPPVYRPATTSMFK